MRRHHTSITKGSSRSGSINKNGRRWLINSTISKTRDWDLCDSRSFWRLMKNHHTRSRLRRLARTLTRDLSKHKKYNLIRQFGLEWGKDKTASIFVPGRNLVIWEKGVLCSYLGRSWLACLSKDIRGLGTSRLWDNCYLRDYKLISGWWRLSGSLLQRRRLAKTKYRA